MQGVPCLGCPGIFMAKNNISQDLGAYTSGQCQWKKPSSLPSYDGRELRRLDEETRLARRIPAKMKRVKKKKEIQRSLTKSFLQMMPSEWEQ